MLKIIFTFCLMTIALFSETPLKINIFTNFNGKGLETDQRVLKEAIETLGHSAESFNWFELDAPLADINIFIEKIVPEQFHLAKLNWFISNPEWYDQDVELLEYIDLILCRTKQSMRIFKDLNKTFYLGFTCPDAYRPNIRKNFSRFVHLPGSSEQKGTKNVLQVWKGNISLPFLTLTDWQGSFTSKQKNIFVIPKRLEEEQFRILQNRCGIHVCPSSAEGFGHSILEAMSSGAVVITTNGAPMNEFVSDGRCLIPVRGSKPYRLGTKYEIINEQMKEKVVALSQLSTKQLSSIGHLNRQKYLARTREFYERLEILLTETTFTIDSLNTTELEDMEEDVSVEQDLF